MQYPGCVGCRQTVGDPDKQFDNLLPFPSCCTGPLFERAAIDEFGYQVVPFIELADIMDRENVRMVERGCRLRFASKSPSRRGVRPTGGNEFDGDGAIELR